MKINVLTIDDMTIGKWRWWSNWIDIAVFDYECRPWLLQMRVSRTNAKAFKSISVTGIRYRQTTSTCIGDLTQMPNVEVRSGSAPNSEETKDAVPPSRGA